MCTASVKGSLPHPRRRSWPGSPPCRPQRLSTCPDAQVRPRLRGFARPPYGTGSSRPIERIRAMSGSPQVAAPPPVPSRQTAPATPIAASAARSQHPAAVLASTLPRRAAPTRIPVPRLVTDGLAAGRPVNSVQTFVQDDADSTTQAESQRRSTDRLSQSDQHRYSVKLTWSLLSSSMSSLGSSRRRLLGPDKTEATSLQPPAPGPVVGGWFSVSWDSTRIRRNQSQHGDASRNQQATPVVEKERGSPAPLSLAVPGPTPDGQPAPEILEAEPEPPRPTPAPPTSRQGSEPSETRPRGRWARAARRALAYPMSPPSQRSTHHQTRPRDDIMVPTVISFHL